MARPWPKQPATATLDKYGLTLDEWKVMAEKQGGVCGVCRKLPVSERLVIDHLHAPGWKHKPPEERKKYVRGLCCTTCNHFVLTRYATAERHRQAADYLDAYSAKASVSRDAV